MSYTDVQYRQRFLRERFGRQRWIELASETAGAAYRLAGMKPKEFRDAIVKGDRSPGWMRTQCNYRVAKQLRPAFGAEGGMIRYLDGIIGVVTNARGFSFRDAGMLPWEDVECHASLNPENPLHPSVFGVGLAGARIRTLIDERHLPHLVASVDPEIDTIGMSDRGQDPYPLVRFRQRYESLARMPDRVADELGIERQTDLIDVPWLHDLGVTGRRERGAAENVVPLGGRSFEPNTKPSFTIQPQRPPILVGVASCRIVDGRTSFPSSPAASANS